MVKKSKNAEEVKIKRRPRAKVSREEALKRMADFSKQKDKFVAAVRKGKN